MILRTLALTSLALFVIAAPAQAGGGKKGEASARVLAHFDKDHNGVIDGAEVARVQAVYAALYALDTDHDGKLSETELAAAKIPTGRKGGKKKATQ